MKESMNTLKHVKKRGVIKWLILGMIPVANIYVAYKVAVLLAAHDDTIVESNEVAV